MNIRALRLPILFSGFVLALLVSLNAFSLRSNAQVVPFGNNFYYGYSNFSNNYTYPDYIIVNVNGSSDDFVGYFTLFENNQYIPCVVTKRQIAFSYSRHQPNNDNSTINASVISGQGQWVYGENNTYWYYYRLQSAIPNNSNYVIFSQYVYTDAQTAVNELITVSHQPAYADFGFNNISYATYLPPSATLLFDQYHFDSLSYYFQWSGSTDPDYPITSYNYALYGYSDVAMDNIDTSNGTLVSSGTDSVSNHFNYAPPYGAIADSFHNLLYDKVVLYLTPFSGTTEGNTFYVVLNVVRGVGWSVDLGPFELSLGDTIRDYSIGDGIIQVPTTDVIEVEDGKYIPVGYIDNVPIAYTVQNTYGIYNTSSEYHVEYNNYSPVIYGDSEYVTNNYDDHSTVVNNNQTYNNIVNNISPDLTIDSDSDSYGNKVISFLTSIVMFLQTCWVYFVQSLLFFPDWVTVLITTIVGLLGTVIIALGVIKLL